ncbi:MAG: phosphoribosylglycinamide formyltransferase [Rhodobiaceae bacterium]|nr:phosphoribosylglycinamide formyltransferase [Rhodobiaceae bacterium]MCC0014981.1 phosphoribosylglycinamide formyltransferase [Rhodobiaceae bacterium]MCC0041740.1 phosphoribosylglycinamide formyltransferase [Rhodobiaceae bacterium]MCC0053011.1 phosphoribosylglycinamide formyltransferase [Rhodobiaceae bacterium]
MTRRPTAILISGRGSNMVSLIAAAMRPDFPAEIRVVISNRPDAAGLERARTAGVEAIAIDHKDYASKEDFEGAVQAALDERGIQLVCLAGFMRILTDGFLRRWGNNIINIHPSLLPAFKGLDTHHRALESGVRIAGCTVHVVRPEMDSGPIIAQAAVPVLPDDSEDTLAARVLDAEHQLYPRALALYASGKARVSGERIIFEGDAKSSDPAIYSLPAGD